MTSPQRGLRGALSYLVATRLVVNTAHRFVYPFLPAIARGLGISLEQAGFLVAARSATGMATPLLSATAGRHGARRRLAVVSLAIFGAGALITAATGVIAGAVVGFVLLGLGKPSFDAAAHAYIADRTPYARRARYLSVLELTWATSLLAGAPFAGWMISRYGWRAPFWFVAVAVAIGLFGARIWMEEDPGPDETPTQRLRLSRTTGSLLGVIFLYSFSAETTSVVFGAWLETDFDLSLVALGGAATVVGIAELAGEGGVLAFADSVGKKRMVVGGLAVSALGYSTLALWNGSLPGGLAAMALAFIAFEVTIVTTIPLATEVAAESRATYLALIMVSLSAARAAGSATGPAIFNAGGLSANATVSAGVSLLALAILWSLVEEP